MAAPDHDRFRERFSAGEFAADRIPDDALDIELATAYRIAGEYVPAFANADREVAAMYLAAHNLTSEQSGSSQSDTPGSSVSKQAGTVLVGQRDPLETTRFGRAFKVLVGNRRRGTPAGTNYSSRFGLVA